MSMWSGYGNKLSPQSIRRAVRIVEKAGEMYETGKRVYNTYASGSPKGKGNTSPRQSPKQRSAGRATTSNSRAMRQLTVRSKRGIRGNTGATNSTSSGFLKKGTSRTRKGDKYDKASKGVVYNLEKGDVTVASKCEYIGHASLPYLISGKVIAGAIVKTLCEMKKTYYTEDSEFFHGQATRVIIEYRYNQQLSTATVQQDFAAGDPVSAVVTFVYNQINSIFFQSAQATMNYISILESPASATFSQLVRMPLQQSKIHLWSKSTLKIQNRSKIAADDEADDVDNVPLYGKSYDGSGNGTGHIKNGLTVPMFADSQGIIEFDGGSTSYLNEPPQGYEFLNAKFTGKAHLDPGHIKTSVLNGSRTGRLNDILQAIMPSQAGGGTSTATPQLKIGSFRLFALEKMIETLNTEPTAINLAYEHNLRIGAYLTVSYPRVQCTVNTWP